MNYNDDDIGCSMCGKLNFIFAVGSYSMCENCSDETDNEIEANGGLDKCLNCGKYKYGNQLNKDQVCKIGCRNPQEY